MMYCMPYIVDGPGSQTGLFQVPKFVTWCEKTHDMLQEVHTIPMEVGVGRFGMEHAFLDGRSYDLF